MIQFQSRPFNMIEVRLSRLENMYRNKKTLPIKSLTIPDTSNHINENKGLWNLEDFDQDSISSHKLELDQFQTLDKLVSFSFNEIELECECNPDPQPCDSISIFDFMLTPISFPNLDQFLEPIFILVSIDLEIESPILNSHIPLLGRECESQFFDLDLIIEQILTLEPKVNFFELVLVHELFISEAKSSITQNRILLLDQNIDHNDSVMIFQDWSYEGNKCHDKIFHEPIHIGDCKYVNRKGQ